MQRAQKLQTEASNFEVHKLNIQTDAQKEVLKAANWASDQVTRVYRTGRIAIGEQTDIASAS